jgi:DNA-binding MarR family transcriptional regulator
MRERTYVVADVEAEGERIADLLWEVNRLLRERLVRWAGPEDMPRLRGRFRLLARVTAEPGITLNELARRCHMTRSQASVLAAELEGAGLLAKRPDPADRRLVRLHSTAAGRHQLEEWRRAYRRFLSRHVRAMPPARARDLVAGLEALRATLADGTGGRQ